MHVCEGLNDLLALALTEEIGVSRARRDGVHRNALGSEVLGEDTDDLLHCAFTGDVEDVVGWDGGVDREGGGEEDDACTWWTK